MTTDGIRPRSAGYQSGGYMGSLPNRSAVSPQSASELRQPQFTFDEQGFVTGVTLGGLAAAGQAISNATERTLGDRWSHSASIWSSRELLGRLGNRVMGDAAFSKPVSGDIAGMGMNVAKNTLSGNDIKLNYARVFDIPEDNALKWRELFDRKKYMEHLDKSYEKLRHNWNKGGLRGVFRNMTLGQYLKETVVQGNLDPVREAAGRTPLKEGGYGKALAIARTAGLGFLAFDILRVTRNGYLNAKAQEDGTFGSKVRTWYETAKTFVSKAAKSLVAWEVAGAVAALAKPLLPAVIGVNIGAIMIGALGGALIYYGLNKLMPDPERASQPPPSDSTRGNPFAQATLTT